MQSGACDGDCCSVCYSPMIDKGLCNEDGRYVFTLPCSHRFHLRCLQKSREFNIDQCPMCRAPIPAGFTPQVVKERRRRQLLENSARVREITNMWTSREVMVGRAATAREAVRLAALRRIREQEEVNLRMMQRQTASLTLRQSPSDGVDDGTEDLMDEDDVFPRVHEGSVGLACSHCENPLCERQDVFHPQTCYVCMQPFCARCSTLDYRTRQERAICLDCLVHQRP